jgi:lysophospholipase L1-like esterase
MSCNLKHQSKNSKSEPIKFLALGDSYTVGESVLESERWPVQLVEKLKDKNIDSEVTIIAKTGWTTDELLKAIKDSSLSENYNLVSLLIGVNNQYRGRSTENFKEEFRVLLNTALAFAGNNQGKVFVVSIPDWGVTPFAQDRNRDQIASEIDLFNQICKEVCLISNVLFIDITDISRKVYADEMLVAMDGLHPSGKMYGQWVNRIFPHVIEIIKK